MDTAPVMSGWLCDRDTRRNFPSCSPINHAQVCDLLEAVFIVMEI
jgi:hypothetical protein